MLDSLGLVLLTAVDAHEEVLLHALLEGAGDHDVASLGQRVTQEDGAAVLKDGRFHYLLRL